MKDDELNDAGHEEEEREEKEHMAGGVQQGESNLRGVRRDRDGCVESLILGREKSLAVSREAPLHVPIRTPGSRRALTSNRGVVSRVLETKTTRA